MLLHINRKFTIGNCNNLFLSYSLVLWSRPSCICCINYIKFTGERDKHISTETQRLSNTNPKNKDQPKIKYLYILGYYIDILSHFCWSHLFHCVNFIQLIRNNLNISYNYNYLFGYSILASYYLLYISV
jgi:hypothetical protein